MKKASLALMLALAALLPAAHAQAVTGNAEAGARKNAMCIGCHGIPGYRASFPRTYSVPMISGQDAAFIRSALEEYRKGARRNPTMRGIAGSLTDQDIADLAAYYSQHGGATAAPPAAALPAGWSAELKAKVAVCVTCHGSNFSTPVTPGAPRLAGQHADYLALALGNYQAINAVVGNDNAIMKGQAASLTRSDISQISRFLGSLPGQLKVVPEGGVMVRR